MPNIINSDKNKNQEIKEKKTFNSLVIPLSKKSKESKAKKSEDGQDYNEDSTKEIKKKKTFNSLFIPLSRKSQGNKTNEKESGKDYNEESNNPIDSNEDNTKDFSHSNIDKSKEPKEKENMISNTKQISSSKGKSRKFDAKLFALKSQDGTETNESKKGSGAKKTSLKQESLSTPDKMKGQPTGINSTNDTRTAPGSETTNNEELEGKSHTEEKEPQTGDAKVTKPWLLWMGGQPGYWKLNGTTDGLRS